MKEIICPSLLLLHFCYHYYFDYHILHHCFVSVQFKEKFPLIINKMIYWLMINNITAVYSGNSIVYVTVLSCTALSLPWLSASHTTARNINTLL